MYVLHRVNKASSSVLSSTEDSDLTSLSDSIEPKTKNFFPVRGFTPRAGNLVNGLVNNLSLAKSQSICTIDDSPVSLRTYKTDGNEALSSLMLRRGLNFEAASGAESESNAKLNSLVSVMVSTIMCLAANCPIPKSNIQATKLFLGTVVNENGESPRNIKALLNLLKNYDGPYEGEPSKLAKYGRSPSAAETVINATEVVLEPALPRPVEPAERARPSRTRSRLPSLSPIKKNTEQRKYS